jgi:hypothetical protein
VDESAGSGVRLSESPAAVSLGTDLEISHPWSMCCALGGDADGEQHGDDHDRHRVYRTSRGMW